MVTKQIKGTKQLLIRLHVNRMVDDKNIIPDREGHRKRKYSLYGCYFEKYCEYPCKNFTLIDNDNHNSGVVVSSQS